MYPINYATDMKTGSRSPDWLRDLCDMITMNAPERKLGQDSEFVSTSQEVRKASVEEVQSSDPNSDNANVLAKRPLSPQNPRAVRRLLKRMTSSPQSPAISTVGSIGLASTVGDHREAGQNFIWLIDARAQFNCFDKETATTV